MSAFERKDAADYGRQNVGQKVPPGPRFSLVRSRRFLAIFSASGSPRGPLAEFQSSQAWQKAARPEPTASNPWLWPAQSWRHLEPRPQPPLPRFSQNKVGVDLDGQPSGER